MELILVLSVTTVIIVAIAFWLYKNRNKQKEDPISEAPYKIEAPVINYTETVTVTPINEVTEVPKPSESANNATQEKDVVTSVTNDKKTKKQPKQRQPGQVNKAKIEKASKPKSRKPKMTVAK